MRVPPTPRPGFRVVALQIYLWDDFLKQAYEEIYFFALPPLFSAPLQPTRKFNSLLDLLDHLKLPVGSLVSDDGFVWQDCLQPDWFWCNHCRKITPESEDHDPNCQFCGHAYGQPHPDDAMKAIVVKLKLAQRLVHRSHNQKLQQEIAGLENELADTVTEANWEIRKQAAAYQRLRKKRRK